MQIPSLFKFVGKLFLGTAASAAKEVADEELARYSAELEKVHDDIVAVISPKLSDVPEQDRAKVVQDMADVAKAAAVASFEAYLHSKLPTPPAA